MFERYTEKARRVIFFARYEASQFGAHAIEAEHILLGLLRDDKQLVQLLFLRPTSTVKAIRDEIEAATPPENKVSASVDLPLSVTAKRVLSYAAAESDRLGDRHIGTEHLMLGLLCEDGSLASRLLVEHGVTAEKIIAAANGAARTPQENTSPPGTPMGIGHGGGGRVLDPALLQLAQQFKALVQLLTERGVISQEDGVVIHQEGFDSRREGRAGFGWAFTRVSFTALLDVLARKGVISEEDKQRILDTQAGE
jgi:ATP-dependent Clp protease ATP-binding subunit ClpC